MRRFLAHLGQIRYRLLAVNLLVLIVPLAGLQFARHHERQLLAVFESDMRHQAVLVRRMVEADLDAGHGLGTQSQPRILRQAARHTRMRVRLLDSEARVRTDSAAAPSLVRRPQASIPTNGASRIARGDADDLPPASRLPPLADRREVVEALAGRRAAWTRILDRPAEVYFFVAEPIKSKGAVVGVVYVTRSTQPVLAELYRLRNGLFYVLAFSVVLAIVLTLGLAWSISRPLTLLARAARRISAGEREVVIPIHGGGELRSLGEALGSMTRKLDARLRDLEGFAADVAHEFKSPLTSIRGAAELLAEGAADDPEARQRFLRNIELDSERLDRLVSRLLELSRIEASDEPKQLLDLEALLLQLADRARTPDVAIVLRYEATRRMVHGRPLDLENAFVNLLENALRYAPPGSQVEVAVEDREMGLMVEVRDHGPGVPPKVRERIFERFFTTDKARSGTGLGLAIVRSVSEAHGGSVECVPSPPPGTTFRVFLPVAPQ